VVPAGRCSALYLVLLPRLLEYVTILAKSVQLENIICRAVKILLVKIPPTFLYPQFTNF